MGFNDYIIGGGILPQIILAVVIVFVLHMGLIALDTFIKVYRRMGGSRTELMPNTYLAESTTIQVRQNPNLKDANPIYMSDNELTGTEFSYSFYLNVNKNTFSGDDQLAHVFHKGNSTLFPLLGPGVFINRKSNVMRIYMNSYKTWNNYCEVDNIPVGKWFHTSLVFKNNHLEIYINGNMIKKLSFEDSVPYQNYGDYYFFSMNKFINNSACIEDFKVTGPFSGLLSRCRYFNYALSYSEIQSAMNEGPSDVIETQNMGGVPPYMIDNWWVSK
jgi:hypothetical protein